MIKKSQIIKLISEEIQNILLEDVTKELITKAVGWFFKNPKASGGALSGVFSRLGKGDIKALGELVRSPEAVQGIADGFKMSAKVAKGSKKKLFQQFASAGAKKNLNSFNQFALKNVDDVVRVFGLDEVTATTLRRMGSRGQTAIISSANETLKKAIKLASDDMVKAGATTAKAATKTVTKTTTKVAGDIPSVAQISKGLPDFRIIGNKTKLALAGGAAVGTVAGIAFLMNDGDTIKKAEAAKALLDDPASYESMLEKIKNMSDPDKIIFISDVLKNMDPMDPRRRKLEELLKKLQGGKKAQGGQGGQTDPQTLNSSTGVSKYRRTAIAHQAIKNPGGPRASVKQFQQRLKDIGYDLGSYGADGDYGPATVKAVKAFQTDNDLKVDGLVGTNTWPKMKSDDAVAGPAGLSGAAADVEGEEETKITPAGPGGATGIFDQVAKDPKNYEAIKRTYRALRSKILEVIEAQGASQQYALKAVRNALPRNAQIITLQQGRERSLSLMLSYLKDLMKKGFNYKVEKADVSLSAAQVSDVALKLFGAYSSGKRAGGGRTEIENIKFPEESNIVAPGKDLNESKSYNLKFDKWSKLWK